MVKIQKLSNGIPVLYEYMTQRKSTAIGVFVKMGSAFENQETNGISHFIEHMLFKGTTRHSAKELADIMSVLGSDLNAYTAKESTAYYGRVLNEDLDLTVEILGEMMMESAFDEKEVAKEKNVILDEIDLYDDSPEDLCHELLQKHIWKTSPYGYIISGSRNNVKSFKRKHLVEVWKDTYVAENMVISVAGGAQESVVMEILEKTFGKVLKKGSGNDYSVPVYEKCFFSKFKDTEQLHMNIAMDNVSASHPDRYPISIINAILGGNLNARLFQKVREEMGLTYNIYSYSSMFNDAGLFHIYASMSPGQTANVLGAIYGIMEELKSKGITETELATIKKQMKTELILSEESSSAMMNANAKSYMTLGYVEDLDAILECIHKVTLEDIHTSIEKYMKIDTCSISLVGNTTEAQGKELKKYWEQGMFPSENIRR